MRIVPNRIVVAFVAELKVYEFWGLKGRFAELLRILERKLGGKCSQTCATNLATRRDDGPGGSQIRETNLATRGLPNWVTNLATRWIVRAWAGGLGVR